MTLTPKRTIVTLTILLLTGGVVWFGYTTYQQRTKETTQDTVQRTTQNTTIKNTVQVPQDTADAQAPTTTQSTDSTTTTQPQPDTSIHYNADGSIDTSSWKEYCNEEYGFCVKYPDGWEVESFYALSPGLSLGPIDCKQMPEKCKVKSFAFTDGDVDSRMSGFVLNVVDKTRAEGYSFIEKTTWHHGGLITGCEIGILLANSDSNSFILSTFYQNFDSDEYDQNINNTRYLQDLEHSCKNNKDITAMIFDNIAESFRLY